MTSDYKIITVWSEEFIGNSTTHRRVNEHKEEIADLFKQGYKPHGAPLIVQGLTESTILQAWIKE